MGKIEIKGKDAFLFLQELSCNDLSLLKEGMLQYNLFLNEKGTILDDFILYYFKKDYILCIVNASNTEKIYHWFEKNVYSNLEIVNQTEKKSFLSLQGPFSSSIIKDFLKKEINFYYMNFIEEKIEGRKILISRSGYTAEDGFEIYVDNKDVDFVWEKILEIGRNYSLCLCGLGARDVLRIEAGYPLYGQEIDENTNPYEASLGWTVKLNKDFIGKKELIKIKKEGIEKKRVGFIMKKRAMPRRNYFIYDEKEEKIIGWVTSGTYSPNLDKFIGMGYLKKEYSDCSLIKIKIRENFYEAEITKFPFVRAKTKKVCCPTFR
jgi:aminomethyltransferase